MYFTDPKLGTYTIAALNKLQKNSKNSCKTLKQSMYKEGKADVQRPAENTLNGIF